MASKITLATLALFLSLNLLLFSTITAYNTNWPSGNSGTCPIDALKLGVCANLLGDLLNVKVGTPPVEPCCSLIKGLVDLEAAACHCTVIKANVLGLVNLDLPVDLSLLLNACGRNIPNGFQCP